MPEKRTGRNENQSGLPFKRIGFCSVIGACFYFLELVAFSAAELKMSLGENLYLPVGIAAVFVSAFIAGFASVYKDKKKALPCGGLSGAIEAVIVDIILIVVNGGSVGKGLLLVAVVSVAGSAIGAVVAANIRPKRKY